MMRPKPEERPIYKPMTVLPTSKDAFIDHGSPVKRTLILPKEEMEVSHEGKVEDTTMYKQDYNPYSIILPPMQAIKPEENLHVDTSGQFEGMTMNRTHYKDWKVTQPRPRFQELQSFSGKLIFPGSRGEGNHRSTTHLHHTLDNSVSKMVKNERVVHEDNIRVGKGDMDHRTVTQMAFQPQPDAVKHQRRVRAKTSTHPQQKKQLKTPPKMECDTKYSSDFCGRKYQRPLKAITPAPPTIRISNNHRCKYETEQRKEFPGWNVKEHRRREKAKLHDNTKLATGVMSDITTTKEDFVEQPVEAFKVAKRPSTTQKVRREEGEEGGGEVRSYYETSNKSDYRQWAQVRTRQRYGDFHEANKNLANRVATKVSGSVDGGGGYVTTSASEFGAKKIDLRASMKPVHKMAIDSSLLHDFHTTSRLTFTHPPSAAYEIEEIEVIC